MKIFEFLRNFQSNIFEFPSFGLDISDASFHFAKAESFSDVPSIEYSGEGNIPKGIIELGEIKNENELSKIIKTALAQSKRIKKDRFVVASLPEEKAFLKLVQIPMTEGRKETENAVLFEAESSFPISAHEMYFDYEDISPKAGELDHKDILIVAFPRAVVDSYVRVLHGAGLEIVALELESQGIVRALIDIEKEGGPYLVMDIGRTKSGFVVFSKGAILFTSTVPIGGRDFETAIQEAMLVSPKEAEKIKKEVGFSNFMLSGNEKNGNVYTALAPLVSVIIDEAEKSIDFFETHVRHTHDEWAPIEKIILCGGDSYLIGLSEEIGKATGKDIEYGNPVRFFKKGAGDGTASKNVITKSYTTALGLCLRAIR